MEVTPDVILIVNQGVQGGQQVCCTTALCTAVYITYELSLLCFFGIIRYCSTLIEYFIVIIYNYVYRFSYHISIKRSTNMYASIRFTCSFPKADTYL